MHIDNLIRMANRIGDFFDSMPCREEALTGISEHIRKFWEPRMRRELMAHLAATGGEGLSPILVDALTRDKEALTPA